MPYTSTDDLPPAFTSLPQGAKTIALQAINTTLHGKAESQELVTQAIRAAWSNVKEKYRKQGDSWVAKGALLAIAPEGLGVVHEILAEEMERRGLPHTTDWPTVKMASQPTLGDVHIATQEPETPKAFRTCPACGHTEDGSPEGRNCPDCGSGMVAGERKAKAAFVRVVKADDERQTVAGVVYMADDEQVRAWVEKGCPEDGKPDVVDTQGDWIGEANLRESFDAFMRHVDHVARSGDPRPFGLSHRVLREDMTLLQSALVHKGTHWPEADTEPLTASLNWVQQIHVGNPEAWEQVKRAEFTGFSLEGLAVK